jgi:hypothetical protein
MTIGLTLKGLVRSAEVLERSAVATLEAMKLVLRGTHGSGQGSGGKRRKSGRRGTRRRRQARIGRYGDESTRDALKGKE